MPKTTTYKTTSSTAQVQRDIHTVHEELSRTAKVLQRYDRVYVREIERADKRRQKGAHQAQRARELLAAGNTKEAARAERRARLAFDSAERIRAKAEQRRNERHRRVEKRRTAYKWALAAILAAAAAVAAGSAVMTPSVATGVLEEPKTADVEISPPPAVGDHQVHPESAGDPVQQPEPATDSEQASQPEEDSEPVAPDVAADSSTGAIVHAVYVGSGSGPAAELRAGVPFTITPLDGGESVNGVTTASTDGTVTPLRPGAYRLTLDDSGFDTITCEGLYTRTFEISTGQRATATAYFFDQGDVSYGTDSCLQVAVISAE